MLVYRQLSCRGYAKNHAPFYKFKKKYNSHEVSHGFEHISRVEPTDPDRAQTRITADVSIPMLWLARFPIDAEKDIFSHRCFNSDFQIYDRSWPMRRSPLQYNWKNPCFFTRSEIALTHLKMWLMSPWSRARQPPEPSLNMGGSALHHVR